MAHNCDNCEKELDRLMFCDNKCRMQYVRKANRNTSQSIKSVRNANKPALYAIQHICSLFPLCKKHGSILRACGCCECEKDLKK